jgi:hypothetical protein
MKKILSSLILTSFLAVSFASANGLSLEVNAEANSNGKFNSFLNLFRKNKGDDEKKDWDRKAKGETYASSTLTTTQKACLATAVEKRDNAIIDSVDTIYTSIRNALVARKVAVTAAINASTSTGSTNVSAYTAYKTSLQTSYEKFKTDKKLANSTLKTDVKNCGIEEGQSKIHLKADSFFGIF